MSEHTREKFREQCRERDNETCLVPWCDEYPEDVHHILERELWQDGGYVIDNGASVCNHHHRLAETNDIPPQAFWLWAGIEEPPLPESVSTKDVDKWGSEFETPPHGDKRRYRKYPSSRHLLPLYWRDEDTLAKTRMESDDTGLDTIDDFLGIPLVVTHKIDGGNCTLVSGEGEPVRARNGRTPKEGMRPMYAEGGLYWTHNVGQKLPEHLQIAGEWVYEKHSIHYGCECEEQCDDVGPYISELTGVEDGSAYFQVFGVYDNHLNMWLSWPSTEYWADKLGFPTAPVVYCESSEDTATFESEYEACNQLIQYARDVIENGGEGIVVRSKFPFHFGQFSRKLGKYVRENHVKDTDERWERTLVENQVSSELEPYEALGFEP
jgi:hypothetical protein